MDEVLFCCITTKNPDRKEVNTHHKNDFETQKITDYWKIYTYVREQCCHLGEKKKKLFAKVEK